MKCLCLYDHKTTIGLEIWRLYSNRMKSFTIHKYNLPSVLCFNFFRPLPSDFLLKAFNFMPTLLNSPEEAVSNVVLQARSLNNVHHREKITVCLFTNISS